MKKKSKAAATPFHYGHPGIGKTQVILDIAKREGYEIKTLTVGGKEEPKRKRKLSSYTVTYTRDDGEVGRKVVLASSLKRALDEVFDRALDTFGCEVGGNVDMGQAFRVFRDERLISINVNRKGPGY